MHCNTCLCPCVPADSCGSWGPARPQCLHAEPGLLGCWIVFRKTLVPVPLPSTPQHPRCPFLPAWVELALHLCHYGSQRRGYCQWYCLPRILHCFRLSGGRRQWNHQGTGEQCQLLCLCTIVCFRKGWIMLPQPELTMHTLCIETPLHPLGQQQMELQDGWTVDVLGHHQTRGKGQTISTKSISVQDTKDKFHSVVFEDWQQGGKSEVYLWGNGRYGQLAGMGTNLVAPTLAPSLLQTQQVLYCSNVFNQTRNLPLMLPFHNISPVWLLYRPLGCVWTKLYFLCAVQRDCTGYRRGTIWETGSGEFWWSLRPHSYLCFSRYWQPWSELVCF